MLRERPDISVWWLIILVLMLSTSACSTIRRIPEIPCRMSFDEAAVERCREALSTADPEQSPRKAAALGSLESRLTDYRSGKMTCDKFRTFYNGHIKNHCNQ